MRRDVEDLGHIPEDLLGPITVVHVPIDDEDSLALTSQCGRGDRDVVQQTKSHRSVSQCVVPGWPGRDEAHAVVSPLQFLDHGESGAGCVLGDCE